MPACWQLMKRAKQKQWPRVSPLFQQSYSYMVALWFQSPFIIASCSAQSVFSCMNHVVALRFACSNPFNVGFEPRQISDLWRWIYTRYFMCFSSDSHIVSVYFTLGVLVIKSKKSLVIPQNSKSFLLLAYQKWMKSWSKARFAEWNYRYKWVFVRPTWCRQGLHTTFCILHSIFSRILFRSLNFHFNQIP